MTDELKPCPFCGSVGLDFLEGSTFRWRRAECVGCGATLGDTRIQTTGTGTQEEWEEACRKEMIEQWNTRHDDK